MKGIAVTLLVASGLLAGPAAPAAPAADDAPAHSVVERRTTERVRIVDFAFRPRRLEVQRGTRVRWTNRGSTSHTTTSTKGIWSSGPLAPGDTFSRVFRSRGVFRYVCSIHPDMRGRVIVT